MLLPLQHGALLYRYDSFTLSTIPYLIYAFKGRTQKDGS